MLEPLSTRFTAMTSHSEILSTPREALVHGYAARRALAHSTKQHCIASDAREVGHKAVRSMAGDAGI
jgi:hypothetical protein